jgi:AcrR family transcriptional regulator
MLWGVEKVNKYEITTERKKQAIVQAALTLFNEKGFVGVSIKEIAARARVSQVSIYNYFGSKDALVAECADTVIIGILQKAIEILDMDINYPEKLQMALSLCSEEVSLAISTHFSQIALSDPKIVGPLVESVNRRKAEIYRAYIEHGKQDGYIYTTIDTNTILLYTEAINTTGSKLKNDDSIQEQLKHVHHLFLYGIIGQEKSH